MRPLGDIEAEFNRLFPEWEKKFAEEFECGTYIAFGQLTRELELLDPRYESEQIRRIFDFVDEVASWGEDCETMVHIQIGEWIVEQPQYLPYAGPLVRRAFASIAACHRGDPRKGGAC